MGNCIQKLIYIISNIVPMLFIGAIAWVIQNKTWEVPLIIIFVAVLISISFILCFRYMIKQLSAKTINISGFESKDFWIAAYVLSYLSPFITIRFPDYNILVSIIFFLILLIILNFSVNTMPNFLLFCCGYHFYKLETDETGNKDYLLISKKSNFAIEIMLHTCFVCLRKH